MTAPDPVAPAAPAPVAAISKTTLGFGAATLGGILLAIEMVTTSWLIPEVLDKVDVRLQQVVPGMLDEAVAGQEVTFGLSRVSTLDETLTIIGGIGTLSYVANPPIDADIAGNAELSITADGSPLTEGVDYQVNNLTTGEIQWLTSQSGKVVEASYYHRGTEATPAFGSLLTTTALSDGDGRVFGRVAYADDDDLVGQIDKLEVDLS